MENKNIYSYDYVTVETAEKFAPEAVDCYEALGWEYVKTAKSLGLNTVLTFKRDRKVKGKEQLMKLQAKLDAELKDIQSLELKKTKGAFTAAIALGMAGALTFGGGMCLCMLVGGIGAMIGGIALGLAGLALAGLGYLVYRKMFAKKSAEMDVRIDKKRDQICQICEEARNCL